LRRPWRIRWSSATRAGQLRSLIRAKLGSA
jgi:hypothetical protein